MPRLTEIVPHPAYAWSRLCLVPARAPFPLVPRSCLCLLPACDRSRLCFILLAPRCACTSSRLCLVSLVRTVSESCPNRNRLDVACGRFCYAKNSGRSALSRASSWFKIEYEIVSLSLYCLARASSRLCLVPLMPCPGCDLSRCPVPFMACPACGLSRLCPVPLVPCPACALSHMCPVPLVTCPAFA